MYAKKYELSRAVPRIFCLQGQIGSLHDTVTWRCQSSKTVVVQNRCQKRNEHLKNMKVAKFEPPYIAEWVFVAAWIFGKFEGFVWKILLLSRPCSPATFSIQIFVIQIATRNTAIISNAMLVKKKEAFNFFLALHHCHPLPLCTAPLKGNQSGYSKNDIILGILIS